LNDALGVAFLVYLEELDIGAGELAIFT